MCARSHAVLAHLPTWAEPQLADWRRAALGPALINVGITELAKQCVSALVLPP